MIRAAIIGLGTWGQHLVRCVGPDSPHIRFTAAATRSPDKAAEFARAHALRMLPTYEAALADPDVDAGKPVFTEKPLGVNAADAARAAQACADAKVTLGVGYNWRFQPALQAIRAMIEDGTLGRILHVEGNFCGPSAYRFPRGHWRHDRTESPAGGMTGRGVHVVDAMLYLAGPIAQVTAHSARLVQDFGTDDTTAVLFRFASGATGTLATVIATAETWRLQVFGSNAWAEVGDVEHLPTWSLRVAPIDRNDITKKSRPETITFPDTNTERAELEHFARHAEARRPLVLPGGDPVHNVAVLEAILASIANGAPVRP